MEHNNGKEAILSQRYQGKRILITGGTGSWGTELVAQLLLHNPAEIHIYSRGEAQQVLSRRHFENNPILHYIIGDVRDISHLTLAMNKIDIVFHLAALKHVPVCEENPWETVRTNVIGTQNVIDAAQHCHVQKVIYVSSDKGVDPLNLYGITKLAAEKLIVGANTMSSTAFTCFRAGNVVGTSGSVIPLFREQILRLREITLTEPHMTRFFIPLRSAIASLLKTEEMACGGETFILKMRATKIVDLAELMIEELSGDQKVSVRNIGIRPGEKIHELLISRHEASRTIDLGDFFVVLPLVKISHLLEQYTKYEVGVLQGEYSSANAPLFLKDELRAILREEGWLDRHQLTSVYLSRLSEDQLRRIYAADRWLGLS